MYAGDMDDPGEELTHFSSGNFFTDLIGSGLFFEPAYIP
jgi:hypothetical protein